MKICEFSQHQLNETEEAFARNYKEVSLCRPRSPIKTAMTILMAALETVNKAGLDGKELSCLTLIQRYDPTKHADDQMIEIHAKVKDRLSKSP